MKAPVAIISSAIAPVTSEHYGGITLAYDPEVRLAQTRATVESLLALGIDEIYLADNSGSNWRPEMAAGVAPARVNIFDHYPYRNKGISELYLLLAALPRLPKDRPIVKVSGRYLLHRRLDEHLGDADLVVRQRSGLSLLQCATSTIAYAVRNSEVFERFLLDTRRDVFGFPSRIVGPGSLMRIVRNSLFPARDHYPYDDPGGSIEHASWRALHNGKYRLSTVASLGIEGSSGQTGDAKTE